MLWNVITSNTTAKSMHRYAVHRFQEGIHTQATDACTCVLAKVTCGGEEIPVGKQCHLQNLMVCYHQAQGPCKGCYMYAF